MKDAFRFDLIFALAVRVPSEGRDIVSQCGQFPFVKVECKVDVNSI